MKINFQIFLFYLSCHTYFDWIIFLFRVSSKFNKKKKKNQGIKKSAEINENSFVESAGLYIIPKRLAIKREISSDIVAGCKGDLREGLMVK